MSTRVITSRTLPGAVIAIAASVSQWLGHSIRSDGLTEDSEHQAPWTCNATGAVRVEAEILTWNLPVTFTVTGTWPATVNGAAVLTVTSAPVAALAMPALCCWIVANTTASTVTVGGVAVLTKTCVLLQTDSDGTVHTTALGTLA